MEKLILILTIVLWSSCSLLAAQSDVLMTMGSSWVHSTKKIEVTNMPRERDQDSTPFCTGFAAQQLLQHAYCEEKGIADCSKIQPEQEFSPLSVVGRCFRDNEQTFGTSNRVFHGYSNHQNVPVNNFRNPNRPTSCDSSLIVAKARFNRFYLFEYCYPFDQFANRFPARTHEKLYLDEVNKIEKYYDKYKTEGSICEECFLKDVNAFLYPTVGMKSPSSGELLAALKEKTKDKMWFGLFGFKTCKGDGGDKLEGSYTFNSYPNDEVVTDYSQAKKIFLKAFSKNRPVSLGVCFEISPDGDCTSGHAFVIYGFDRMCKIDNPKICMDAVKLRDSMGKDRYYKDKNGNPMLWIEAERLFRLAKVPGNPNSSMVDIAWIEPN